VSWLIWVAIGCWVFACGVLLHPFITRWRIRRWVASNPPELDSFTQALEDFCENLGSQLTPVCEKMMKDIEDIGTSIAEALAEGLKQKQEEKATTED
jgi:hypothetical protein